MTALDEALWDAIADEVARWVKHQAEAGVSILRGTIIDAAAEHFGLRPEIAARRLPDLVDIALQDAL